MICQRLIGTVAVGYNQHWPLNALALGEKIVKFSHTDIHTCP